jgi:hypothetical protein
MKKITLSIIVVTLLGCAVSTKVNYDNAYADVPAFNQKMSIATWDQREQVVSGARKPDFVGYMRSGAGIAYPMGTTSGKPFSDVMSTNISSSLSSKGSPTNVIITNTNETASTIIDNLKKSGNNRLILMDCKQFHTDGYGATSLLYDLKVNIYDGDGTILKQKTFSGKKPLGGSVAWGPGKYKQYMPEAFKNLIEEIFNDAEIASALKNP